MSRLIRYLWASPTTLLGLMLVPLAFLGRGRVSVVRGVLEVHGGLVSTILRRLVPLRGGAAAITLGHVVFGRDEQSLERTRIHERVHVRQAEIWGPLFVPAYLLGSAIALVRGRHPYRDNPFEQQAFLEETRERARPSAPSHP